MRTLTVLFLVLFLTGICFPDGVSVYTGALMLPIDTHDFRDIHVSDWQNYGTGSSEGRVHLPLGKVDIEGQRYGAVLGVEFIPSSVLASGSPSGYGP